MTTENLNILLKDLTNKQKEIINGDDEKLKYFDLSKVKELPAKRKASVELLYSKILKAKDKFKNSDYVMQVNQLLLNTSFIWLNNKGNKFNDSNIITLNIIARCILTLGLNDKLYLSLIATKNNKGFNIVKLDVKTRDEFIKFYDIKLTEKKQKKEKTENKNSENEKNSTGDLLEVNEDDNGNVKELANKVTTLNEKLSEYGILFNAINGICNGDGTPAKKIESIKDELRKFRK